jgi:N-acetylglucosamine-6-phosphate deacetylase
MMRDVDHWIVPDLLFADGVLQTGQAVLLQGDRVAEVCPVAKVQAPLIPLTGILTPGFVDLQVNGGGGVLLNQTPTPEGMAAIAAAHRRFGTVAILPTLITDAPEVLDRMADAALAARGQQGIAGVHIEGPHISVPRRGTHAERFVRPLDDRTIAVVRRLRQGGIAVMITLAPEAVHPGQIATLVAMGAVVSIGHSDTTAEGVRLALAEGASCFTHLFNAMSPLLHRSPGVVGAALNSSVPAGIICDGIHVADELVGLAIRARPAPDLMFLVSDAMPTVGGPDHFRLYDMDLHLENGRLVNAEGSLAGAHVTMAESVARLVAVVGIDPAQALRMAVTIPARVMGLPELADVAGRETSDLMVLDSNARLQAPLSDMVSTALTA